MDDEKRDIFRHQLEQKPTAELIQLALTAKDEDYDPGWETIWVLRYRATRDVFDGAKTLCKSDDPQKRMVGVAILAQLGIPDRTFLDETLEIFFKLVDTEQDVGVLNSVLVGLGHIWHEPRKVMPLLKFKNHPDVDVRFGVAFGLQGEDDPAAISTLIELTSDEDDDVRDWATFGLGTQIDVDTPEIREALYICAIDSDDESDASGEGLLGLARRHDERAFSLTLKWLEKGGAGTLIFEAAEELADARLLPALVKLRDDPSYDGYERDRLEDAIAACQD